MFNNYFKIAWRNLMRNRAFSFTNLLGLTIGIICTILILLWVQSELSWDTFQPNYNTTYQVMANRNFNGETTTDGALMLPLAKNIETGFPQVKDAAFTTSTIRCSRNRRCKKLKLFLSSTILPFCSSTSLQMKSLARSF